MNFDIEKITNGYLTTLNGVKTFHDTPEAICGHMAEFILESCKRFDAKPTVSAAMASAQALMKAQMDAQAGAAVYPHNKGGLGDLVGWRPSKIIFDE